MKNLTDRKMVNKRAARAPTFMSVQSFAKQQRVRFDDDLSKRQLSLIYFIYFCIYFNDASCSLLVAYFGNIRMFQIYDATAATTSQILHI